MIKIVSNSRKGAAINDCFDIKREYRGMVMDANTFKMRKCWIYTMWTNKEFKDLKLGNLTYQGLVK